MKYLCSVCGYIYDEQEGNPENNVPEGTLWEDVPPDWKCPICNAPKSLFNPVSSAPGAGQSAPSKPQPLPDQVTFTSGEKSAILSNLAKGFEKQYKPEASDLCYQLSDYFLQAAKPEGSGKLDELRALLDEDLSSHFTTANAIAEQNSDRGSMRALKWAEQVTRMTSAHLNSYTENPGGFLVGTHAYVCEICGFIYIGDEKPDICPVCKVPSMKMTKIERGA